jgi:hypothetical protein
MNIGEENDCGFKRITVSNWKAADEILQYPYLVPDEIWVKACLKPALDSTVPKAVIEIFEVARGAMIYGWFFYPLITLAAEQCNRVLEAGARARCEQLGLPIKIRKRNGELRDVAFAALVDLLAKHGALSKSDRVRWDAGRRLRNSASHPSSQSIISTGMAISSLESTVELVNKLFT